MKQTNVFDWAQVKLAEECLKVLFKSNVLKQHVVAQLANAGGVSLSWDENGLVKLEGPWEQILKSQTVFENYLSSLELSHPPSLETGMESGEEQKTHENSTNQGSSKSTNPIKNKAEEENEVYVNITLSNAEFSNLYHESLQVVHISEDDTTKCDSLNQNMTESSCPHNNEISASGPNNLSQTRTEKRSPEQNKLLEKKDNINVFDFQPKISFNNCNILTRNCETSVSEDPVLKSICFSEEQHVNNISSSLNSGNEVVNSNNNSLLSDNKPTLLTLVASEGNRKNVKKKDYEELAPFKFFCTLCSFKSKRESHFVKHMKLHNTVSELFKCTQCTFTSIRLSHLRRHELSHSNIALSCTMCQYRTNNQKLLVRHQHIKHRAKKVSEGDLKKDILHCVHCDYQTSRYCFLQRHMKIHAIDASVQVYQCEQCSYKTNYKEHFVRHTNNVHKGIRPFLCHRCGKAFKRQDALKQHSVIHATQAAVICSDCGKGFKSQAHLSQHMSVHSSDRSFLCELCGACFKTRAVQRKHMITIHQHPKSFLCNHCSRKFSTKFALKRHNKQHSFVSPAERKNKRDQQASSSKVISSRTSILKLETKDSPLFSEPAELPTSHQHTSFITSSREGEKITLQLTETFETEMVQVVPAQPVVHCNSETTALVYLAGTFTQM